MPWVGVGAGYLYHDLLDQNTDGGVVFAKISIPISGWWRSTFHKAGTPERAKSHQYTAREQGIDGSRN